MKSLTHSCTIKTLFFLLCEVFFLYFLVTKHKGTEKRESPSPAPKPRKVELSESEEDKGSKMAAADSVQQRRQYRRQNQQSSSGMDNKQILCTLRLVITVALGS